MSVAKVSEIIASSTKSFDDAIKIGIARSHKTLTHLKSAWIENQQSHTRRMKDRSQEYRVQIEGYFHHRRLNVTVFRRMI